MSVRKKLRRRAVLRRIDYRNEPLETYVDRFQSGETFSFARYGDGEWNAILGYQGSNVDGHEYFPELGARLGSALQDPRDYVYSMLDWAMAVDGFAIARYLRRHDISIPWFDSDVFHEASRAGELYPLVAELRARPIVVVSSDRLRKLEGRVFDLDGFIEVDGRNCWLEYERIRDDILAHARAGGGRVYAFSASMTTNVLIHELYPVLGADNWLIDFGSLWDIYAGVVSREGFDRDKLDALIARNLGESR